MHPKPHEVKAGDQFLFPYRGDRVTTTVVRLVTHEGDLGGDGLCHPIPAVHVLHRSRYFEGDHTIEEFCCLATYAAPTDSQFTERSLEIARADAFELLQQYSRSQACVWRQVLSLAQELSNMQGVRPIANNIAWAVQKRRLPINCTRAISRADVVHVNLDTGELVGVAEIGGEDTTPSARGMLLILASPNELNGEKVAKDYAELLKLLTSRSRSST